MLSVDSLIIYEAKRWLNVVERGGDNRGQIVQMFQKAVDNRANGEAWCAAFAQYCVRMVHGLILNQGHNTMLVLPDTEHCMTMWRLASAAYKSSQPHLGDIAVWQRGSSISGHCGVVIGFGDNCIYTIEGNTGGPGDADGVFFKKRNRGGFGSYREVGFIQPISDRVLY